MKYYSYQEYLGDLKVLFEKVNGDIGCPDAIIAIARGGLSMAHFLSIKWDLREVYSINAISYDKAIQGDLVVKNIPTIPNGFKNVLIVDEIVDSGKSLKEILRILKGEYPSVDFHTCAIFQKQSACIEADFFVKNPDEWIDFFWEVDLL